jgi:hypothetical protein
MFEGFETCRVETSPGVEIYVARGGVWAAAVDASRLSRDPRVLAQDRQQAGPRFYCRAHGSQRIRGIEPVLQTSDKIVLEKRDLITDRRHAETWMR